MYGQKKEGADYAYDNTWSYSALYATLAETGDVLYLGLREGYRHTSYGTKEVLPGTIERVSKHFRKVRMRADSGYYSQALVQICRAAGGGVLHRRQAAQEPDERRTGDPGEPVEVVC